MGLVGNARIALIRNLVNIKRAVWELRVSGEIWN